VIVLDGQWCNVMRPYEYPKNYQTALHICVSYIEDKTRDEDISAILKLLLEAGKEKDILVKTESMTIREILEGYSDATGKKYPVSMALLEESEAQAGIVDQLKTDVYEPNNSSIDLKNGKWAQITDFDTSVQRIVSRYIDIYQWTLLKQTSKCLTSWPKPPPPPFEYHLIMFCFSDGFSTAFFGFSKSLSAVLEAFKSMDANNTNIISFQFIHINDMNQAIIPLVQYKKSECQSCSADELSGIHPYGKMHFGVKEAGESLPKKSTAKGFMRNMDFSVWNTDGDIDDEDRSRIYNRVLFDDENDIGAFVWFEGLRPTVDIDLRHLWHTDGTFFNEEEGVETYELWINKDKANEHTFDFDDDGEWAVCTFETYLWGS